MSEDVKSLTRSRDSQLKTKFMQGQTFSFPQAEEALFGQIVKANNVGEVEIFFTKPMQVVRNLTLFHLPSGLCFRKLHRGEIRDRSRKQHSWRPKTTPRRINNRR